jgi:hypothetical protein
VTETLLTVALAVRILIALRKSCRFYLGFSVSISPDRGSQARLFLSCANTPRRKTMSRRYIFLLLSLLVASALALNGCANVDESANKGPVATNTETAAAGKIPITTSSEEARKEFLQGRDLNEKLLIHKAVAELQQANQQNPYDLYRLCQAYQAKGDATQAKDFCKKAAEFNSLPAIQYAFIRKKAASV